MLCFVILCECRSCCLMYKFSVFQPKKILNRKGIFYPKNLFILYIFLERHKIFPGFLYYKKSFIFIYLWLKYAHIFQGNFIAIFSINLMACMQSILIYKPNGKIHFKTRCEFKFFTQKIKNKISETENFIKPRLKFRIRQKIYLNKTCCEQQITLPK